jgi:hypothetical protein
MGYGPFLGLWPCCIVHFVEPRWDFWFWCHKAVDVLLGEGLNLQWAFLGLISTYEPVTNIHTPRPGILLTEINR